MGTSISFSDSRSRKKKAAQAKLSAATMVRRSRLDGTCVNTIVLMSPMRFASHAAAMCEAADSRRPALKRRASVAAVAPKRSENQ